MLREPSETEQKKARGRGR
jgi:hypothetical protein